MEIISNASVKWHVKSNFGWSKYVKGVWKCICSSCKLVLNWVLYGWVATMIGQLMVYKCSLVDVYYPNIGLCVAMHYQWQRNGEKYEFTLWKSSSIWMKIWNDIACNLNSIQILNVNSNSVEMDSTFIKLHKCHVVGQVKLNFSNLKFQLACKMSLCTFPFVQGAKHAYKMNFLRANWMFLTLR